VIADITTANISRRSFVAGAAAFPWVAKPSPTNAVTLRVSATPSIFKKTFETLSREFQRRHPGTVIELTASARDQEHQIQDTMRRALIGDLPDVSFEGLKYLRILERRRIAVPLDGLVGRQAAWTADFGDSLIESARVGRSIVGLGAALSVPIIYYNASTVASATGSNPLPQDWDQLLTLIAELGRTARPGMLGGFMQHASTTWNYLAMVESLGGSMMNASENRITFDDPPGRRALQIHAAFGRAGQARADMDREQARQAFASGAIALLVDSSSSLALLEKQIGGRFPLGTARIPVAANGRIPVSGIAAVLMAREPSRQAVAWDFIKFVCGSVGQTIIGKSTGYFPANDGVMKRPEMLGSYYEARPLFRPVVASLPFASRWYAFPGNNSAKIDSVIIDGVGSVIRLSKTPDQALSAMRRAVQVLLPESRA